MRLSFQTMGSTLSRAWDYFTSSGYSEYDICQPPPPPNPSNIIPDSLKTNLLGVLHEQLDIQEVRDKFRNVINTAEEILERHGLKSQVAVSISRTSNYQPYLLLLEDVKFDELDLQPVINEIKEATGYEFNPYSTRQLYRMFG